ncbi:MAG: phosphate ABC transporter permease subunit PstC [Deltaproteobacteria bacterium]|nr:phosphate ABC transporter permease subunit PstC [Deltaproteobacteria bacterium]
MRFTVGRESDERDAGRLRLWPAAIGAEVNLGDRLFRILTAAFAALIVLMLAAMAIQMTRASALSLSRFGFGFLVGTDWDPVRESFGALPFIYGTIASSLLALIIAVPISLAIAIYLSELSAAPVRRSLGFVVELLAAIPSVVFGLWGVFVLAPLLRDRIEPALVPFFGGTANGFDLLAAAIILAIMILPTISSVSRDVMAAVPKSQREGALALGATRWETVRVAVLPSARSGIVGAIILGLGRALGETMAVTMVIGNRGEISLSILDPSYSMAAVIANEYTEATGELHLAALSEITLLLFIVTLALNAAARFLVWRVARLPGEKNRL